MSQIKIFGLRSSLSPVMKAISDVIHSCVVDALHYPVDKRAIGLSRPRWRVFYPAGRTVRYTIIEISMFEGRSVEAKKSLIRLLFERFESSLGIGPEDVEITIFETPMHNWGFRGLPGDEHSLNYKVNV